MLNKYKTPKKIYNLSKEELLTNKGFGESIVNNILDKKIKEQIFYHINYMEKNNIGLINIQDNDYPKILKEIYDPPISLYIKGNKKILNNNCISIIGCRECTNYGKMSTKYFAYNLSKKGNTIVSGLAKGIDSYAHIGCMCAKRKYNCSLRKWLR